MEDDSLSLWLDVRCILKICENVADVKVLQMLTNKDAAAAILDFFRVFVEICEEIPFTTFM